VLARPMGSIAQPWLSMLTHRQHPENTHKHKRVGIGLSRRGLM